MEHANEFCTLHRYECFAAFLGKHSVNKVEINTSCEKSSPTMNTVISRIMVFAKLCFVAACFYYPVSDR
jgi:hypothetical protein